MPERPPPTPRTPRIGFTEVPRAWLAGSIAASHIANGVNLLFPAREQFFVRAVHPGYVLRIAGLFFATACLGGFWISATKKLLAQDGVSLMDARREIAKLEAEARREKAAGRKAPGPIATRVFLRGILAYMRP